LRLQKAVEPDMAEKKFELTNLASGKKSSAAEFEFIMAHEVFHCFQFALAPTLWESTPDWIIEGMASWAAWVAYPPPVPVALDEFKDYVKSPAKPLFARDYDAMGFWARADEVGGGAGTLFPKVPSLLTSGDSTASAIIAGATSLAFQETWASAVRRYAGAGSAWNQLLPYSVSSASVPTPASPIAGNASLPSTSPLAGKCASGSTPAAATSGLRLR